MPNVNGLLEISEAEVNYLYPGVIFLVKDLFKRYEWNRTLRSDQLLLITFPLYFVRKVNTAATIIEKKSSKQKNIELAIERRRISDDNYNF